MAVGMVLRRLRERACLSQEELAERAGISVKAVSALERGDRQRPYPRTLRALMTALQASEDERSALLEAAAEGASSVAAAGVRQGRFPLPRPAQLPADIADFTGRAGEVAALAEALGHVHRNPSSSMRICAISGKAGAGKSTLAVHMAHLVKRRFVDGQLYASLHGQGAAPNSPSSVLGAFLRSLGVRSEAVPQQLDEQAALYRSLTEGRKMLVVLDDARDEAQVRPLLPGSSTCAMLVTSRRPLIVLPGAELHELSDLTHDDAVSLLMRVAGRSRAGDELAAADDIVRLCGRLPLAVRIAGAQLRQRPHWPLSALVARLDDEHRRLDQLRAGDLDVRASFSLSYRGLTAQDAHVFRLVGLLPASSFCLDLVAATLTTDRKKAEESLERLRQAQLIQLMNRERYTLHDLVRAFSRERTADEEHPALAGKALERALRWYLHTARHAADELRRPDGEACASLAYFEAEWSSLVQAVSRAREMERWDLACGLAEALQPFFTVQAHWAEEELTRQIGRRAAHELGDRQAESRYLTYLGTLYSDQGRWQEAVELFHQSIAFSRSIGDDGGEARALYGLGRVVRRQGKLDEARRCQEESLRISRVLGDPEWEGRTLNALGVVLSNQGEQQEAALCYERSLALLRQTGDRHSTGAVLVNLGDHYRGVGRLGDAAACYEEHLKICDELGDHDCALWSLAGLASLHLDQGQLQEALLRSEQLLAAARRCADRAGHARALRIAGDVSRARKRWEEAADLYQQDLAIHKERGDLQNQVWALNRIGDVRVGQGRLSEASEAFEESLSIARRLSAPQEEEAILRRLDRIRR